MWEGKVLIDKAREGFLCCTRDMLIDGETIVVLRQSSAWVYLVSLFQLITNKGMHALHFLTYVYFNAWYGFKSGFKALIF